MTYDMDLLARLGAATAATHPIDEAHVREQQKSAGFRPPQFQADAKRPSKLRLQMG